MALPNGVESAKELLDAQSHVCNHTYNYINSMTLKCAVQLGIPDAIHKHGKPITLSELADALSINKAKSKALFRLMRILVHAKLFDKVKTEDKKEAYCLTGASHLLLRDEPFSIAACAVAMIDPSFIEPFHHLSEWFGNEHPSPFFTKYGKTLWEYGGTEQSWNQLYNESMESASRLLTSVLVKECRQVFEGMEAMVDVGGGTGTMARGIAAAFPSLKCTVLDLPHVVAGLEGCKNLRFVGGDMFESIPHADAVSLKGVLHDWNDEECILILEKCQEAITRNGGKVIIVEMVVDEEKEDEAVETQLLSDVMMMTMVTGKERTENDWAKLFFAAGFQNYKITPSLGLWSVIEVYP